MSQEFRNVTDPRFTEWTTASEGTGGCLYVARANDGSDLVAIAESEHGPHGEITVVPDRSWQVFLAGAKAGAFDHI